MLDEPTPDSPTTTDPAEDLKPVRRRRATKATAAPATPATAEAPDSGPDAGPDSALGGDPVEAPAVPVKRARKAPAKKAATPRKRASKAVPAGPTHDEDGQPVGDDPVVQESIEVDGSPPVVEAPAGEAPAGEAPAAEAPAKRTRTRRAAVVTFQAPEPVAAAPVAAPPGGGEAEAGDEGAAPRRRRRSGTAGAGAPGALQLIEPVPAPSQLAPEPASDAGTSARADAGPETDVETDEDAEDGDRPRRRRRGRRGRGPRRPEDEGGDGSTSGDEDDAEQSGPVTETGVPAVTDEDDEDDAGTRRRRRRRRSGTGTGEDAVPEEAPAARAPRAPRNRGGGGGGGGGATTADEDGVRGITGSTRMAAKRVRRQEGRDSGRKRTPILSEAEFLARREAVDRTMVVRQRGDRTQIAVLEDGVLVEHYVTRASAQSYAGNVYLGRVQNVLPSMEAAFVDIGKSRNAVLYAGEVNYNASVGGRSRSIESVLKSGQEVLVQVSKDPIGHKGSRLTGQVSLPGRYLVYVPEGSMTGISRKLPEIERNRLKAILKTVVPDEAGVIIRTAAEGASEDEIAADVRRLQAQWEVIKTKAAKGGAPALLHAEPDLVIRVVRDVFNEDFTRLVVSGDSEWDTIKEYVDFVAPDLAPRLSRHTSEKDVFAEHRVDEQLLKALDRKVWLPSGGSLVIDRTEAMVVVDVNTGKYVGKGGNLEETVTRNNLEAAEEIARQLRLRDLGGIIVVDFIDMVLESNRDLVVRRLVECLGRDRTKHQVAEVTSLGLVQMTRKRVGQGLLESFSEPCERCDGRGVLVHSEPVDERAGGNGDEVRRERTPKARALRPLPADAPKPGAAIAAAERAAAEPTLVGGSADGADTAAVASPEVVEQEVSVTPRRRRRGGRGAGAATVPAAEELAELLSPTADAEAVRLEAETALVQDGAEDAVGAPDEATEDLVPESMEDSIVEFSETTDGEPEAEQYVAPLGEMVQGPPGWRPEPWSAFSADRPLGGTIAPPPDPPAELEAESEEVDSAPDGTDSAPDAAPRQRRRATSRPAGPPA